MGSILRKQFFASCIKHKQFVEAQFLVIKDSILCRQRQFNVNMLLDKLFSEFEEHFKIKLLSFADGPFDGVYSKRFMGFSKNEKTGIDFFVVSKERFFFAKSYGSGWEWELYVCVGGRGGGEACVGSTLDKNLIT